MNLRSAVLFLFLFVSFSLHAQENPVTETPLYRGLEKALSVYEDFARDGEWPKIPKGPKLEPGGTDTRVSILRHRLKAEKIWNGPLTDDYYDEELVEGVKRFQSLNGLFVDGVVGPSTVQALNIKPSQRVCQIRQNLERLQTIYSNLEETYLLVNIPEFKLHVVKDGREINLINVIAGRHDRKTPLLDSQIQSIIFSPSWHVPSSIAVKDKLSKIKADPGFLAKNNMHLYEKAEDGTSVEVDPYTVDWTLIDKTNFTYSIKQDPGDGNALGYVKFVFPNSEGVYMHDTSQRELFASTLRPFSSGCVRVEKPLELAEYLLANKPNWPRERIETAMHAGRESGLVLETPMPIHIVYYTAWGTGNNTYTFRPDFYGYDRKKCE